MSRAVRHSHSDPTGQRVRLFGLKVGSCPPVHPMKRRRTEPAALLPAAHPDRRSGRSAWTWATTRKRPTPQPQQPANRPAPASAAGRGCAAPPTAIVRCAGHPRGGCCGLTGPGRWKRAKGGPDRPPRSSSDPASREPAKPNRSARPEGPIRQPGPARRV